MEKKGKKKKKRKEKDNSNKRHIRKNSYGQMRPEDITRAPRIPEMSGNPENWKIRDAVTYSDTRKNSDMGFALRKSPQGVCLASLQ